MQHDPIPDSRSHRRTNIDCDLTLNPSDMPMLPATAINLSASGIYCVSSRSLGEMTRIDLVLRIEGIGEIPARAVVIREEELSNGSYGIGLFFTRIPETGRDAIIRFTRDIESTG